MVDVKRPPPRDRRDESILSALLTFVSRIIQALFVAWVLAVLIEFIGMTWGWSNQGVAHSRELLQVEQQSLERGVQRHVLNRDPRGFGVQLAHHLTQGLFGFTHLDAVMTWATTPPTRNEDRVRAALRRGVNTLVKYLIAAKQVTQIYGLRLAVLILALPVFALFGVVGIVEGLVRRDLRRWRGGRESAFIYHWYKRFGLPIVGVGCTLYLALPFSVTPEQVITPLATTLALAVSNSAASFKKYL